MGRWLPRALCVAVLVAVTIAGTPADAKSGPRRTHQLLFLPVLAELPPLSTPGPYLEAGSAVANCDPVRLLGLIRMEAPIPTTGGRLPPTICAVLHQRSLSSRLLVAPLAGSQQFGTPAGLSGSDVRAVKATFAQGQGYAVELTLTSSGLSRFNELAAALFRQNAPRNEVAMVVDGIVYSSPAFQASSFSGTVQITGNFTPKQAAQLAAAVRTSG
jgi:hypothetical protein